MFRIKSKRWRLGPALLLAGMIFCLSVGTPQLAAQSQQMPVTGIAVPGMESLDRVMKDFITGSWGIPGGALAVVQDGRLVYARGFGWADKENNQPVQPESLFRLASVSKPITAVTVLKLVEEGKLDLDANVFCESGASCLLADLQPPGGVIADARIYKVTVRNLLQHAGGWDSNQSFDPMFMPTTQRAAQAVGVPPPASCEVVIRFMLGQRLDFDPGTRYAYSNFGYCVLGRIIEKVTGQNYEEYVKANVLKPMGINRMRSGHTLPEGRAEGEVRYYDYPGAPLFECVFPSMGRCPGPYGKFYLEAMDSLGAWIASAIDLLRFVTAVDGRRPPAFLRPETVSLMLSRPTIPAWTGTSYYYAMGWWVRPVQDNWWHIGGLAGTATRLVREGETPYKLSWVALFNSRPQNSVRSRVH